MATSPDSGSRVLKIVQQAQECDVEELTAHRPEMTWNQVFLALDRLSRSSQILLKQNGPGHYSVTALAEKPFKQTQIIHYA